LQFYDDIACDNMNTIMKKEAIEIPNTPFAFIWFAIKPYKKWFFWAILFVLMSQFFSISQTYVFRRVVDSISIFWIMAIPSLLLLSFITRRSAGFLINYLTVYARTASIKKLFEHLSLHSLSYFNDRFSGALSSKVNDVGSNVAHMIVQFIYEILGVLFALALVVVILFSTKPILALIFISSVVILIPLNLVITRKQIKLSELMIATRSKLAGQVIDAVTNISAVQQYARRLFEIDRIDQAVREHREADARSDNFREKVILVNNIIVWAIIFAVIMYAFSFWSREIISAGQLIMVITLTLSFDSTLSRLGERINNLMESYGEMKEALSEITLPHSITDKLGAKKLEIKEGVVVFDKATFAYDNDPRKVFHNLSFNVKGGEKIGIVGTSGAGKTTLMKLLLRQHDLLGGGISIDEQDIRNVTQESLRENISVVPQEPMLFHRSIRENIMYGKLNASDQEMIEVAKKAQAHDFIETLPQRYNSLVGERGVKLSVGQRQRIAIARAFLKNAPILILDEATSALDSESEVAVQKALHALMEGKTVFAIAHRLSTLRDMDRILVFKDGQIVEDGTHRTLLKNKEGVYASFWSHQAGGFIK